MCWILRGTMLLRRNPFPDHGCSSSKWPKIVYVERIEKGRCIAWKSSDNRHATRRNKEDWTGSQDR